MTKLRIFLFLIWLQETLSENTIATGADLSRLSIASYNFQSDVLHKLEISFENISNSYLEEFSLGLNNSKTFAAIGNNLKNIDLTINFEQKLLLIKQLIDSSRSKSHVNLEELIILRNVNFLQRIHEYIYELDEEYKKQSRQIRVYELCMQFNTRSNNNIESRQSSVIFSKNRSQCKTKNTDSTSSESKLDVFEFGLKLYESVKKNGADIIDEYLNIIRQLIQNVINDNSPEELESMKLDKFLMKIDNIISVEDLYEKYKKLCAYLENNLTSDYEEFKSSQVTNEGLKEILNSIKENGVDLFSMFLFSNFEFLEKLHNEWQMLLPTSYQETCDDDTLLLINIYQLFKVFKNENESSEKYEKYMTHVKLIQEKTSLAGKNGYIFELLMYCSQNIGGVTMNIIKSKCNELFN